MENFLFNTSNARASSRKPMVVSPVEPAATAPDKPVAARGLLVALVLLPPVAVALFDGSASDGVGCNSADRLLVLWAAVPFASGGDCESAREGGGDRALAAAAAVEVVTAGSGPGMVRPGPGGVVAEAAGGGYVRCWARGDSSLMRTGARCGDWPWP